MLEIFHNYFNLNRLQNLYFALIWEVSSAAFSSIVYFQNLAPFYNPKKQKISFHNLFCYNNLQYIRKNFHHTITTTSYLVKG